MDSQACQSPQPSGASDGCSELLHQRAVIRMRRPNQRLALLWRGSGAICPVVLGRTHQLQSRSPLRELPRRTTGRRARPSSIGAAACKQVRSPSMGPRPRANGQRWADQGPYSCCAMPKYMPRSIIGSAASSLHDQPAFTVRPTARRLGRIGGERQDDRGGVDHRGMVVAASVRCPAARVRAGL